MTPAQYVASLTDKQKDSFLKGFFYRVLNQTLVYNPVALHKNFSDPGACAFVPMDPYTNDCLGIAVNNATKTRFFQCRE